MFEKIIDRIKEISKGNLRVLLTFSIAIPLMSLFMWIDSESDLALFIFFFGFFIFWGIVALITWIIDGYKGEN